jgi:uncharacterized membrane protein
MTDLMVKRLLQIWDRYNAIRTTTSIAAFACLLLAD